MGVNMSTPAKPAPAIKSMAGGGKFEFKGSVDPNLLQEAPSDASNLSRDTDTGSLQDDAEAASQEGSTVEFGSNDQSLLQTLDKLASVPYTEDNDRIILAYLRHLYGTHCHDQKLFLKTIVKRNFVDCAKGLWRTFLPPFLDCHFEEEGNTSTKILIIALSQDLLFTMTDNSKEVCSQMLKTEFYQDIFEYLTRCNVNPESNHESSFVIACLAYLLNVFVFFDPRYKYRACNAVGIATRYKSSGVRVIKFFSEMLLPHVIDDSETDKVYSDDKDLTFMLELIEASLELDGHRVPVDNIIARTIDIVIVVNKLCANENNLESLVRNGVIPLYVKLLSEAQTKEEEVAACKGLWLMAFKYKEELINTEGCLSKLKEKVGSYNAEVRKEAEGALWVINDSEAQRKEDGQVKESSDGHIMISYQWESKPTMKRIKMSLEDAGYKVWMDEDQMTGSLLESMADGVEKACVVLVTLTHKYKESPNCKTEAEYAYRLNKRIIPLQLEHPYKGDGWLGALAAMRLYFNFSFEEKFDLSFRGLTEEIKKQIADVGASTEAQGTSDAVKKSEAVQLQSEKPVRAAGAGRPGAGRPGRLLEEPVSHGLYDSVDSSGAQQLSSSRAEVEAWSPADVASWLDKNDLGQYKPKFAELNGSLLLECQYVRVSAPEYFFKKLCRSYGLSVTDGLKFSKSLQKL